MGKTRFNKKSRQIVDTIIDNTETEKIQLDLPIKGQYDQNNMLVLPSKKRKTKIKQDNKKITRILSRKHRKQLEKIVEKKKKKENRATLLEALSKVQATPDELQQLTSIATIQTKGLKRYIQDEMRADQPKKTKHRPNEDDAIKLNTLRGAKRRDLIVDNPPAIYQNNPNIVGFETSDSSDNESVAEPIKTEPVPEIVRQPIERKPAVFVDVLRDETVQQARLKLPILSEEQHIMETINANNIVIICGETGCGKTTQIPQFLYEAGYCLNRKIGVTEPRRIAAITMSKRIAYEMNLTTDEISYLIRFEGNVGAKTKIEFMTDGVLLKAIQQDLLLKQYSVIILDEVHERSINTDILIGFLTRIVQLRAKRQDPLKLILMSATIRLEDFLDNPRLFKRNPPVIEVNSRQFPVTIHFNKRTNSDYLQEAYNKVVKIHTKLPDGGILVFLTGQQEVNILVRKLRQTFPYTGKSQKAPINLDDYSIRSDDNDDDEEIADNSETDEISTIITKTKQPLWVLPLYSLLPADRQNQVFQRPPDGCRLCIIATNVAETSLTIPNIKYVVDSGKTKQKLYDKTTGINCFVVTWTSQASAEQRAGRAGRTQSGHCYRLYSSAVFLNDFPKFLEPEIKQKPIDDLYLLMKSMNINKIVQFPFVTAPDLIQLKTSEKRLEILGALQNDEITQLGRTIVKFPVLPRYGKMLALSHQFNLFPYTIALISTLSVQELLLEQPIDGAITTTINDVRRRWLLKRRQWAGTGAGRLLGDFMVLLCAIGAAEYANTQQKLDEFCNDNGLRCKAVKEIRKLRLQLTNIVNVLQPDLRLVVDPQLPKPSDLEIKLLRQILLSGYGDQIAKRLSPDQLKQQQLKHAYNANDLQDPVFIAEASILRKHQPEFVIYQDLYETKNRIFMRNVCVIEPEWLPIYVPKLCNLSEPLEDPPPDYSTADGRIYCFVTGTFGRQAWQLPIIKLQYPKNQQCCKWFCKFFLDGRIYKQLQRFGDVLLVKSSTVLKTWAKLNPRTEAILKRLVEAGVFTKDDLDEIWLKDSRFLLREYLEWLPEDVRFEVEMLWPPKY